MIPLNKSSIYYCGGPLFNDFNDINDILSWRYIMKRSISAISLALAAFLVMLAAAAWACTPSRHISLSPQAGSSNVRFTVEGTAFTPGVPVEIRWNDPEGPVVGASEGPEFSVSVSPPSGVEPGVYFVVALQSDNAGNILGRAAETFVVMRPNGAKNDDLASVPGRAASGELWNGLAGESRLPEHTSLEAVENDVSGQRLAWGGGLLGLGVALAGTSTALIVRRRRTGQA